MAVLGNSPTQQAFTPAVDVFSGNGSTTAFTLSRPVASVAQVEAVIENVMQSPVDAYTVSGNTITFTSAPPSGSSNIYVRYTSPITQVMQPADSSVGLRQLNSDLQGATYGMKNRIINGAMVIDQRNAGASVSIGTTAFPVDRFSASIQQGSGHTGQRSTTAPSGFVNSVLITVGTGASPAAGNVSRLVQIIEGFNVADFGWGTASAATITLSFWVRSSVTGTFAGGIYNGASNRTYVFTYAISAANTWEQKSITIAGDTSGTWATDNSAGFVVNWDLGTGSTYQGTAGSWAAGAAWATSGSVKLAATSGATFYITGVQLEKGSTATSFDYRDYGRELAMCQRYYQYHPNMFQCGQAYGTGTDGFTVNYAYPVTMRIAPTATIANGIDGGSSSQLVIAPVTNTKCTFQVRNNGGGSTSKWYTWDSFFNAEL